MDLARILRANENCIVTTLDYLGELYGLNIDKKSKLEVMLRRIRDTIRKAKKSLESLDGDWWHSEACFEMFESSHDHIPMKPVRQKKDLVDLSLQQSKTLLKLKLQPLLCNYCTMKQTIERLQMCPNQLYMTSSLVNSGIHPITKN